MVIRKYKPLKEQYLKDFFEKGIRCTHVPEFCDENEGMIESAADNPAFRGGIAAITGSDFSEEEFKEQWPQFHEKARQKYFASCWRLGTREFVNMWQNYTSDQTLEKGFAIETTVGQFLQVLPTEPKEPNQEDSTGADSQMTEFSELYVGGTDHDIHVGAVQYQQRDAPDSYQTTGYQASVNFFKGSSYDYEVEFRLLINPFDNVQTLRIGKNGIPISPSPNVDDIHQFFPIDTREMINRIVLAPAAGEEERSLVENVLDDLGISHGPNPDDDLEIVDSNLCTTPYSAKQQYAAEFRGTANYDETESHLEDFMQDFLKRTDAEEWGIVDFTEIIPPTGGLIVEGYRHAMDYPGIRVADYGHEGLQSVSVNRRFCNEDFRKKLKEEAEETNS